MPFGGITIWMHERVDFANIFSVWHPNCLSLESNQNAKIFGVKKSTVCGSVEQAQWATVCGATAAKTSTVNVIGSLHHMSPWSWALMRCRWIRIIRPRSLKGMDSFLIAAVFRGANIWRECCVLSWGNMFFLSPTPAQKVLLNKGFDSQQITDKIVILDDLSEREAQRNTRKQNQSAFPGWVITARGISKDPKWCLHGCLQIKALVPVIKAIFKT